MHPLVERTLRRATKTGATLDAVTWWDEIQELERLAAAIERPPLDDRLALLRVPVVAGGYEFRRLTLGALEWLIERGFPWFEDDRQMQDLLVFFCMAYTDTPTMFLQIQNARECRATIRKWAAKVRVSVEEVREIQAELLKGYERRPKTDQGKAARVQGFGPLVAYLCDRYKGTPDYWMWDAPDGFAVYMASMASNLPVDNGCVPGKAPDPDSWITKATIRYQRASRQFLEKVKEASKPQPKAE